MRISLVICSAALILIYTAGVASLHGETRQPFRLVQTIPIPDVTTPSWPKIVDAYLWK
jgi:hypothetical protein